MKYTVIIAMLLAFSLLCGCNGNRASLNSTSEESLASNRGTDPPLYPDAKALIEKLNQLKVGDSMDDVHSLIGQPTQQDSVARKESPEIIGYRMLYVSSRPQSGSLNTRTDVFASLWFSPERKLKDITRYNLSE